MWYVAWGKEEGMKREERKDEWVKETKEKETKHWVHKNLRTRWESDVQEVKGGGCDPSSLRPLLPLFFSHFSVLQPPSLPPSLCNIRLLEGKNTKVSSSRGFCCSFSFCIMSCYSLFILIKHTVRSIGCFFCIVLPLYTNTVVKQSRCDWISDLFLGIIAL